MDFLKQNEFNAIRVLFNHDHVLKNDIIHAPKEEPLLFQVRYVEMFAVLAHEAAKRGILVMVACHRITADAWPGSGLWFDEDLGFPESRVVESWDIIVTALCSQWNVFAVDLQNEPHASSWGKGLPTDWNKAAERLGNHVLEKCPRWLVMVEGVGYDPGAPGGDDPSAGYWWGENLVGARVAPVVLSDQSRLCYSPHVYGPSVYMQTYFRAGNFPENMPTIWQQHFAFAQQLTGTPIVIGELGGFYTELDKLWQDWAIPYMTEHGFGIMYFALNPDSEDTGGLLQTGWVLPEPESPEAAKLEALKQLRSTDVFDLCPDCLESVLMDERAAENSTTILLPILGDDISQDTLLLAFTAVPAAFLLIGLIFASVQHSSQCRKIQLKQSASPCIGILAGKEDGLPTMASVRDSAPRKSPPSRTSCKGELRASPATSHIPNYKDCSEGSDSQPEFDLGLEDFPDPEDSDDDSEAARIQLSRHLKLSNRRDRLDRRKAAASESDEPTPLLDREDPFFSEHEDHAKPAKFSRGKRAQHPPLKSLKQPKSHNSAKQANKIAIQSGHTHAAVGAELATASMGKPDANLSLDFEESDMPRVPLAAPRKSAARTVHVNVASQSRAAVFGGATVSTSRL